MRSSLRSLWLSLQSSYWFIPTLLTLFALLLALGAIHLDRLWGSTWLSAYPWFEGAKPEGARAQLTVIASAMIAVSSTVFAITIAAVAYASGNFGPRLLTNFMNDKGNQFSLGVFIATFVFNLVVLRVVRNPEDTPAPGGSHAEAITAFVPQMAMLISAASAFIAVAVLVYFLHHIPASIRIDTVIGGIGKRLIRDIERRFPSVGGAQEPGSPVAGDPVAAQDIGYIKIIDFEALDKIAREEGLRMVLKVRTGDFIHPHLPVLELNQRAGDKALERRLLACFALGETRTPTQDLEFLIDELVEIALRALSPGVNDPFTAITSMHWMGAALAKLADRDLREGPEQQNYDIERVQPIADDFAHFVNRSFGAVRAAAASNVIAAKIFLEVLTGVWIGATSSARKKALAAEANALMEQVAEELAGRSLLEVQGRFERFERETAR